LGGERKREGRARMDWKAAHPQMFSEVGNYASKQSTALADN